MRHRKKIVKLGRMSSHRKAMLSNMAASLLTHKKIHTTFSKAKAVVPLIDKLITWARKGSLHYRRLSFSVLRDSSLVNKLFDEIAPTMTDHNGGYTRIIKAGTRRGDGSLMALIELVSKAVEEEKREKGTKKEIKEKKKEEDKKIKPKGKE